MEREREVVMSLKRKKREKRVRGGGERAGINS